MQRKNYILMPLKSTIRDTTSYTLNSRDFSTKNIPYAQANRSGFAMIMAVVVIIVVATIMMFTLSQTTQTVKRTVDMYLYEQTELHAKSAIEYALFKIAEDGPCTTVDSITIDAIYDVNYTIKYIYKNNPCGNPLDYITAITTDEQNGSVLMDVAISVDADNTGSEPIRFFRRTMQKL